MSSDTRFRVTYRIVCSNLEEAWERAEGVALEQTVEIPDDVVPQGYIRDEIVGQVERLEFDEPRSARAVISYSPDSIGDEITQLMNVVYGNSSLHPGIRVIEIDPGPEIAKRISGSRFGADGIRTRTNRQTGGLICPVIKPQGSSSASLANVAERCVKGGADIIKEDHGLANQQMAPFEERISALSDAVQEANARFDRHALYFPNITGAGGDPVEQAFTAKEMGATGVLLMPGLLGFGPVHALANDPDFDLPIMTHPSFTGSFVLSSDFGIGHGVLYGTLQRLAGSDISVFPNVGGRFGFSADECLDIAQACRDLDGPGKPIMPSPGGGMSVDRASEMMSMYGQDVVYLLGGSLLRYGDKIGDAIKQMRQRLDA